MAALLRRCSTKLGKLETLAPAPAQTTLEPPDAVVELARATVRDGVVETARATVLAAPPRRSDRPRRLGGRPHVLLSQPGDASYRQWLVEGLPRLALVQERFDLSELGFIVSGCNGTAMARVYEESLALFGIRREQIVEVGDAPLLVDQLVYPNPTPDGPVAPRAVELLEQLATRVRAAPVRCDRLYVTRTGASRRRLVNEHEILPMLRHRGFAVVAPETLSLYAQIGLFRGARHVVGPHGSSLTNVVFTEARPSLLALAGPGSPDDFYPNLLSLKRGGYASLRGEPVGRESQGDADFTIDPACFEATLDAWL